MATFPATPKPASIAIKSTAPAFVMAAHSRHRKAVTQNAQFFELELQYPPQTRQEFSPIHGFLMKQKGPVGQFDYVPHTHAVPMGLGLDAAELASSNLVKWSERLDLSPWAYSEAANTALGTAVVAPDGKTTGQLWSMTSASVESWPYIRQAFTTGQLTGTVSASVYMKAPSSGAATRSGLRLYNETTATSHILSVNWAAGVPTMASQALLSSYAIESVGGGWYRLSIAIDLSSYWDPASHLFYLHVFPRINQPGVTAGVHVWGAQTALGSLTVPGYLRTWSAAAIRAAGPRVSLRTNAIAYSSNFSSWWVKSSYVAPDLPLAIMKYGTAPDGSSAQSWGTPAGNLTYAGALRSPYIVATATQYVFSMFVKKDTASKIGINIHDATDNISYTCYANFDAAGVATVVSGTGDDKGVEPDVDGWYRMWVMLDVASRGLTGHNLSVYLYPHAETEGPPPPAEGTFMWGAHLETLRTKPGHYLARTAEASPSVVFESGTTVHLEGWLASQASVLRAGDFIKFAGHSKVYTVVEDASSDGFGLTKLTIEPGLLVVPTPAEVVQVEDVPFLVTLVDEEMAMEWDENIWVRPTVRLLEVL
jgi:hypothetical protein